MIKKVIKGATFGVLIFELMSGNCSEIQEPAREQTFPSIIDAQINEKQDNIYKDASVGIALGKLNESDIDNLDLTSIKKKLLKIKLLRKAQQEAEEKINKEKILKHIDEKTPQDDVPPAYQNKHFNECMISQKQINKDFTLVDAVNYAISCRYTTNLNYLINEIKESIYSKDADKIVNAISAFNKIRKSSKDYLIKSLEEKYINYLDSIEEHLTSNAIINNKLIHEYYEKYFDPKPIDFDTKENIFNEISSSQKSTIYNNFIGDLSLSRWYHEFDVYNLKYFENNKEFQGYFWKAVKDNYIYGGCPDIEDAIKTTKIQIGIDFKLSKINGDMKLLYKPFDQTEIINEDISKADKIINSILKEIEGQFQKYGNRTFNPKIKTTESDRIVFVEDAGINKDLRKFINIEYYKKGRYRIYYEHDGKRIYLRYPKNDMYVEIEGRVNYRFYNDKWRFL